MTKNIIKTENLTKYFFCSSFLRNSNEKITVAVENVNIEINEGEIFGILGLNGAGKTTFLKILSTLILPTKGNAYINGYNIIKESEKVKFSIGFHSGEERGLYWRLTGRENLYFFATFYNIGLKELKNRIEKLSEVLQLNGLDKNVYLYSSGMKQKLSIIRTLLHNPDVLLLDEPTKSLDFETAYEIRKFLKELSKNDGKTILLVTHNLKEAEELCDRVTIMEKGKFSKIVNMKEIEKEKRKEVLEKVFLENANIKMENSKYEILKQNQKSK